jgi:rare lipoprotein A
MKLLYALIAAALLAVPVAQAQSFLCDECKLDGAVRGCYRFRPEPAPLALPDPEPLQVRLLRYASLAVTHRLAGLASYYSASLEGTLTANGERYRHQQLTAAHLTLPLGTWVELTARATGKTIRVRVNDRGPYVKKFAIDLSRAAARALGVDVAEDRWVEDPLPEGVLTAAAP